MGPQRLYVNFAHERFLTHSIKRTLPRSSSNNPTAAHQIDVRMHFLESLLYPKKWLQVVQSSEIVI